MINAALSGELDEVNKDNYHIHSVFNLMQPRTCPNVPIMFYLLEKHGIMI